MVMEKVEILDSITLDQESTHLTYQTLPNKSGLHSKTLSQEQLEHLSVFAETIEESAIMGDFNNEKHYLDTLKLVLDSTNETENRIIFFQEKILPQTEYKRRLLDVGPGNFALTKTLIPGFQHLTAVDANEHILNEMSEHLPPDMEYNIIASQVESAQLEAGYYDLAVLAHILYYIDYQNWMQVIKKAYQSLNDNGKLVIVLGGDERQKAELIQYFGGQTIQTNSLAMQCVNTFGHSKVSLYSSEEAFFAKTQQTMLHIAAFMLKDANITASKDDLLRYIERNLRVANDNYVMTTRQKYIVIKKENLIDINMDIVNEAETAAV